MQKIEDEENINQVKIRKKNLWNLEWIWASPKCNSVIEEDSDMMSKQEVQWIEFVETNFHLTPEAEKCIMRKLEESKKKEEQSARNEFSKNVESTEQWANI